MKLFLVPFIVAIVTQLIKVGVDLTKKRFSWRDLNSYGGFPSSHTAFVVSLITVCGLQTGWFSEITLVAAVMGIIVVRDAVGLRRQLGRHAELLNKHFAQSSTAVDFPHLDERLGHTPLEALAGAVCGAVFTLLAYYLYF